MDNTEYKLWLIGIKDKISKSRIKASITVNTQLIALYWELGKMIVEKQKESHWGNAIIDKLAKDLKNEMPDNSGFSRSNLYNIRQFYLFYSDYPIVQQLGGQLQLTDNKILTDDKNSFADLENKQTQFVQQVVGQIPWGHHILIINRIRDIKEAIFYIRETIENNWSRNVLGMQIESNLFLRQGKAISNFNTTLSLPQADLANQLIKDPYIFDFLSLEKNVQEVEFEKKLIEQISQFLLELGKGFAFLGRQYPLIIGSRERKLDLLFYHTRLHAYIVIELKTGEFEPEYIGKLNYYLSDVDNQLKTANDNPSIGILLCKSKERIEVEYALKDMNKPMGISDFKFNELPEIFKSNMPSIEELEAELYDNPDK